MAVLVRAAWKVAARRATVVAAVAAVALAVAPVPSGAVETDLPTVTVTDQPGAPGQMLYEMERLTGKPLGSLDTVTAIETEGKALTVDQLMALAAGDDVEGVKLRGVMPGGKELLNTTMADLADGRYDGSPADGKPTSTLVFANSVPDGRDWCTTLCFYFMNRWTCPQPVRSTALDLFGYTTLGAARTTAEKASDVSLDDLEAVEVLVGDSELSAADAKRFFLGGRVDSLKSVAVLKQPDPDWTLTDLDHKSGVKYGKTKAHIYTFKVPFFGKFLMRCISQDGGKTYRCSASRWSGF
ncbi:hypothetical protein GCM10011608_38090 [Micromonospora sonchi]|uniref:Uncharacterized protein n=1 Tax=Micromonospora sonchi TaxID=1763543 RepID=A0A917U1B6_9ACTN|nr:hypothetical protein [Micromonospora sonchi]GGM49491.1 hypothetical protein GCM10011608_38090 [Micromonospora sonchi]